MEDRCAWQTPAAAAEPDNHDGFGADENIRSQSAGDSQYEPSAPGAEAEAEGVPEADEEDFGFQGSFATPGQQAPQDLDTVEGTPVLNVSLNRESLKRIADAILEDIPGDPEEADIESYIIASSLQQAANELLDYGLLMLPSTLAKFKDDLRRTCMEHELVVDVPNACKAFKQQIIARLVIESDAMQCNGTTCQSIGSQRSGALPGVVALFDRSVFTDTAVQALVRREKIYNKWTASHMYSISALRSFMFEQQSRFPRTDTRESLAAATEPEDGVEDDPGDSNHAQESLPEPFDFAQMFEGHLDDDLDSDTLRRIQNTQPADAERENIPIHRILVPELIQFIERIVASRRRSNQSRQYQRVKSWKIAWIACMLCAAHDPRKVFLQASVIPCFA